MPNDLSGTFSIQCKNKVCIYYTSEVMKKSIKILKVR